MMASKEELSSNREKPRTADAPPLLPPRDFVPARADVSELGVLADCEKLTVVSYNLLSQLGARRMQRSDMGYVDSALLSTIQRRDKLLREMLSYDADVMCLQEVDDYEDFWAWQLTANGYDSVFEIHPNRCESGQSAPLEAGLVIAVRKHVFQLFRTQKIDLNEITQNISDVNLAAKCTQDKIALCVQIQPWEKSRLPSAICVVTTQLASGGDSMVMDHVRVLQTEFLCRQIAQINAVANLPIILAGTFNALPSSDVYHVLQTGRRRPRARAPSEMERPCAVVATPTSVTLTWTPPDCGDAPILGYKIAVKNCTSATLGFSMHEITLDGGSELLNHAVTMLSAGIPYQFRICARNANGYGPFSQPSLPITTLRSSKLQAQEEESKADREGKEEKEDEEGPPLYIEDDVPPQVKPCDPSFGSGRTPRFDTGSNNMKVSPRKLISPPPSRFSTLQARGDRDDDLVHGDQYESAYACYQGFLSEPEFTYVSEKCIGTIDYIFYSAGQFAPFQLLSMPTLEELERLGVDSRQAPMVVDTEWFKHKPRDWKGAIGLAKNDDQVYTGEWVAPQVSNTFARHAPWLPNKVYASDHLALACVLAVQKDNLAVEWN